MPERSRNPEAHTMVETENRQKKAQRLTEMYPLLLNRESEKRVEHVNTDQAIVVDKNQPLASGTFYGCTALFIFGNDKTFLAHMTSTEKLPVHGFQPKSGEPLQRDYVIERQNTMLNGAQEKGLDLSNSRYLIIAEPGNAYREKADAPKKYSIEDTEEGWKLLEERLVEYGITAGALVRSPLSNFTVHSDPETGGVFLTGIPNSYNEKGHLFEGGKAAPETMFIPSTGEIPKEKQVVYPNPPDRTLKETKGEYETKVLKLDD